MNHQIKDENNYQKPRQFIDKFLLAKNIKNRTKFFKWKQRAINRERDSMVGQQNAKAQGEAAICRLLHSKAAGHKDSPIELADQLDKCTTSDGDVLISRSEQHMITSKKLILEAMERQLSEEAKHSKYWWLSGTMS